MLDRKTFKNRLSALMNFYSWTDKVSDIFDGYCEIFAVEALENITHEYECMLSELVNDTCEDILYWIGETIMGNKNIEIVVDDVVYNITAIDDFYTYLEKQNG
jgi:hypothetical protein